MPFLIQLYSGRSIYAMLSCAWRHCGALADAQEALDQLDHAIGMLEPFECLYCLDVVERSLRDILAVTKDYRDHSISIPDYQPLQRMVSSLWVSLFVVRLLFSHFVHLVE
jgi:hypothetical protein